MDLTYKIRSYPLIINYALSIIIIKVVKTSKYIKKRQQDKLIILLRTFLWYYNMSLSPIAVLHSTERVPPAKIRLLNKDVKAIVQSTSVRERSGDLASFSLSKDIIKMIFTIRYLYSQNDSMR